MLPLCHKANIGKLFPWSNNLKDTFTYFVPGTNYVTGTN